VILAGGGWAMLPDFHWVSPAADQLRTVHQTSPLPSDAEVSPRYHSTIDLHWGENQTEDMVRSCSDGGMHRFRVSTLSEILPWREDVQVCQECGLRVPIRKPR